MIDQKTRTELKMVVDEAVRNALENAEEQYLTGRELCKQFQMFTLAWLKNNGELLPRRRIVHADESGIHRSAWGYPRYRIARMIQEKKINFVKEQECEYRPG